jgi:hypothetical protein
MGGVAPSLPSQLLEQYRDKNRSFYKGESSKGAFVLEIVKRKLRSAWHIVGQVFYGMTTFEWVRDIRRERGDVERLFILMTFGDLLGIPILPPYYTLQLLPYIVPTINQWKRSLLRERDLTDLVGLID